MKSDAQLQQDVMDEFAWDPAVRHESLGVATRDGVVTVTGHLDTFAEKAAVERVPCLRGATHGPKRPRLWCFTVSD